MAKATIDDMEALINKERKNVNYDTKEFTLELLISKYRQSEIFVPFYQRNFVWTKAQKSRFIESLILGLPIPQLFFAEIDDGTLEIIDGSQRIRTIAEFFRDDLKLTGLKRLSLLNGCVFGDLPKSRQRKVNNISIRATVVGDMEASDMGIRHEIFDRLNTGGTNLTQMEVKKGALEGEFIKFVYDECSPKSLLNEIAGFTHRDEKRAYKEEFLVKLFAFSESMNFSSYINVYLTEYIEKQNKALEDEETKDEYTKRFNNALKFCSKNNLVRDITINRKNRLLAIFIAVMQLLQERADVAGIEGLDIDVYTETFLNYAKTSAFNRLKANVAVVKGIISEAL